MRKVTNGYTFEVLDMNEYISDMHMNGYTLSRRRNCGSVFLKLYLLPIQLYPVVLGTIVLCIPWYRYVYPGTIQLYRSPDTRIPVPGRHTGTLYNCSVLIRIAGSVQFVCIGLVRRPRPKREVYPSMKPVSAYPSMTSMDPVYPFVTLSVSCVCSYPFVTFLERGRQVY